jgi:hypothetical protein
MITSLHIIRKALTCAFLPLVLAAELTLFATTTLAQNDGSGMASAPYSKPNAMSFGTSDIPSVGTYGVPTPQIRASAPSQAATSVSLLAVPVIGTAPLTVDFHVGLANTPGALFDEWIFGDGAELFLPAQPYMLHVYQHPGTYICELGLINAQGIATTVFATITVKPAG